MMRVRLAAWLLTCVPLAAQEAAPATELPGHPFSIQKTWIVGGHGNWDYLTLDPAARLLYIAHGAGVQVVDVDTGVVAGEVKGMREAHSIALDDEGQLGYVSDGPAGNVKVFDRRSFEVVATLPTGPSPRAVVFEPQSKLLFAIGADPDSDSGPQPGPQPGSQSGAKPSGTNPPNSNQNGRAPTARPPVPRGGSGDVSKSTVTVIDTATRQELAQIVFAGKLGFALADGNGLLYIAILDHNQILRLDAQAIGTVLRRLLSGTDGPQSSSTAAAIGKPLALDWSGGASEVPADARPRAFAAGCREPHGLAADGSHLRLFVACNDMKLAVLNANTGEPVAALGIGPGVDAIGYDQGRGLIYSANGGGDGSLTIIRRHVTDSYAVIQTLPTRQRARTLAINPATGEVYLVTVLEGVPLVNSAGARDSLKMTSIDASFQVLVVGN
jgi:DNA-binding beta-propeller fold protein YncE